MDYVNGIPALADTDPVEDTPFYTQELRGALNAEDPWTRLDLRNGWASGAGVWVRKDRAGNVHVMGRLDTVGNGGTSPDDAAFILPPSYRHIYPTFLRLPHGTNQLATQCAGYWFQSGEVSFSNNVSAGGYVSINETFCTTGEAPF